MVLISSRYMLSPCFMRWSLLEWMLLSCRRRIQELNCRLICRLVPSLMVRNSLVRLWIFATCWVRRLRVIVRCLIKGSSRLDVSAVARRNSGQLKPNQQLEVKHCEDTRPMGPGQEPACFV